VTDAIETELLLDGNVDSNAIDIATRRGIVTLTGTTRTIHARRRAVRIASATVGVRGVVDMLRVEPDIERSDRELVDAVTRALQDAPATSDHTIDVQARDGVVTLGGTVDSWQEKRACKDVAADVLGVREIASEITVRQLRDRSDDDIEHDVEARLEDDVRVDDVLIDVEVEDGHVTLRGTVGSLMEKLRALDDARVAGVRAVDGDSLDVRWWSRDSMRRIMSPLERTDERIARAVEDALVDDPRVLSVNTEIEVEDGTVILRGVVDHLEARHAAGSDAGNVTGVVRVLNHLKVRPDSIPPNQELERHVRRRVQNDPVLHGHGIGIDAIHGRVYLEGLVDTEFEKRRAARLVRRIGGVTGIVNELGVRHAWPGRPDWEIREEIRDQLFWSPFVDDDDVTVTVENGLATLRGEVATWSEREAAERNALDAGARQVRNELEVVHRTFGPPGREWPF
jgi:osmotically-inducible protein OsmY